MIEAAAASIALAALLVPFGIATTALYYLFARAEVTRPLWSRYGGRLDALARCPACAGWWIGGLLAIPAGVGIWLHQLPHALALAAGATVFGGCAGLVLTPLGMALLKLSLQYAAISPPPGAPDA